MPRLANLALQPDLCYNGGRNIVVPGSAVNTPGRIHSWRNVPMTTLSPHADNGNPNDIPLKRCKKCGEEKPATTEFFNQRKDSKDGLRNDCMECLRARRKTWYAENRDQANAQHKVYYAANRDRLLAYGKAHYTANRDHYLTQAKAYGVANRDRKLAYMKTYHEKNRDRNNAQKKAWHTANRDHALANMKAYDVANRDHDRVYRRSRYAAHRDHIKSYHHKLRAHKRSSEGTYTAQDIQNLFKGQKGKCALCKQRLVKYEVDHIIPLSRGGSNWPYNLQLLCPSCNRHKSNKLPHEFNGNGQMRLL